MPDEIDKILRNSSKAELLETLEKELHQYDKVLVMLIEDKESGKYHSLVMTLGIDYSYEAYGILEVAKQDLQADERET